MSAEAVNNDKSGTLFFLLIAAFGFGAWCQSFGAGVWMFVVLLMADIYIDKVKS